MEQQYKDRQTEISIFERIMRICDKEFPNEDYTLEMKLHEADNKDIAVVTIKCGKR